MRRVLFLAGLMCLFALAAKAQDPVKVDPKHYKVEFENDQVRVLRIHYGPHERSVMHAHPNAVAVFLSDQRAKYPSRREVSGARMEGRRRSVDSCGNTPP